MRSIETIYEKLLADFAERAGFILPVWMIMGAAFTSMVYALFIWLTGCAAPSDFFPKRQRRQKEQ